MKGQIGQKNSLQGPRWEDEDRGQSQLSGEPRMSKKVSQAEGSPPIFETVRPRPTRRQISDSVRRRLLDRGTRKCSQI